jgi:folate-binding protein YgfZ
MNSPPNWLETLGASGVRFTADLTEIRSFGSEEEESKRAVTGSVLVPLLHLGMIKVDGADARAFLHAQLTSDVNALGEKEAQLAAWCTPKGRVFANFIVSMMRAGDEENFFLLLPVERIAAVLERLQTYVLRSKVKITSLAGSVGHLGISSSQDAEGALAETGLSTPKTPLRMTARDRTQILRLQDGRYIFSVARTDLPLLWQRLRAAFPPAGQPVWRWLDILHAFPWISNATSEAFVPHMMDFDKAGGISFKKGCYPGQEIVARTHYQGEVKRHLYRLQGKKPFSPGERLHSPVEAGAVGTVISAAPDPGGHYAALAVIMDSCARNLHYGNPNGLLIRATPVYSHTPPRGQKTGQGEGKESEAE